MALDFLADTVCFSVSAPVRKGQDLVIINESAADWIIFQPPKTQERVQDEELL